jgi:hypothetical protein
MMDQVSSELWISFASLLRSYAAARSLNDKQSADVEQKGDRIRIVAGDAAMELTLDPHNGEGEWRLISGMGQQRRGKLALLPEGRIDIDDTVLDLDHAAIDLVASLMNAAASARTAAEPGRSPAREER